jgi:hypothetical protein
MRLKYLDKSACIPTLWYRKCLNEEAKSILKRPVGIKELRLLPWVFFELALNAILVEVLRLSSLKAGLAQM